MSCGGFSLDEIALYDIVGNPQSVDGIVIIPAFYEPIGDRVRCDPSYPLIKYMNENNYEISKVFPQFYRFFRSDFYQELTEEFNEIWVRARVAFVYGFYPPTAFGWREDFLNIPFLAVLLNEKKGFPSLHPFTCMANGFTHGSELEFYNATSPGQRQAIADAFWKTIVSNQGLVTYIDEAFVDYDVDYHEFVGGYWNNCFHMVSTKLEPSADEIHELNSDTIELVEKRILLIEESLKQIGIHHRVSSDLWTEIEDICIGDFNCAGDLVLALALQISELDTSQDLDRLLEAIWEILDYAHA